MGSSTEAMLQRWGLVFIFCTSRKKRFAGQAWRSLSDVKRAPRISLNHLSAFFLVLLATKSLGVPQRALLTISLKKLGDIYPWYYLFDSNVVPWNFNLLSPLLSSSLLMVLRKQISTALIPRRNFDCRCPNVAKSELCLSSEGVSKGTHDKMN